MTTITDSVAIHAQPGSVVWGYDGRAKEADNRGLIEQAAAAALFYRRLIDEGVPPSAATSMAGQFVMGQVMSEMVDEEPNQPWDEPPL